MFLYLCSSNAHIANARDRDDGSWTASNGIRTVATVHSIPGGASTTFPIAIRSGTDAHVSRSAAAVAVLDTDAPIDDTVAGTAAAAVPSATTALPCRRGTAAHGIHSPDTAAGDISHVVCAHTAGAQSILPGRSATACATESTVSDCDAAADHAVRG